MTVAEEMLFRFSKLKIHAPRLPEQRDIALDLVKLKMQAIEYFEKQDIKYLVEVIKTGKHKDIEL